MGCGQNWKQQLWCRWKRTSPPTTVPTCVSHSTLPYAVGGDGACSATASQADAPKRGLSLEDQEDVRQRFIPVYRALTVAIGRALRGAAAHDGMDVLAREEVNVRTAMRWGLWHGPRVAVQMGDTYREYLERSARLREHAQWSAWLAEAAGHTTFSAAVAGAERDRARSLFAQGYTDEAIQTLGALIECLQQTTAFDSAFQLVTAQSELGHIYQEAGYAERAIPSPKRGGGSLGAASKTGRQAIAG